MLKKGNFDETYKMKTNYKNSINIKVKKIIIQ